MAFLRRLIGSKPKSAASLDALTIQELAKRADLSRPRETLHYLYVPTQDAAQEAEQALRAEDRKIEVRPAATGPGWLVLITQSMIVTPESIAGARSEIEAVSTRLAGEYDGWEAAVTPN